jgi:hypothetical protein
MRRPKVNLSRRHLFALVAIPVLILSTGCSDRSPTDLPVARAKIDPMVFDEKYDPINVLYGEDAYFQPFSGTDPYSLKVDSLYASNGSLSIKVTVPPDGSAMGAYAGGVLTSVASRDFADFNAMTFKARTESISSITLNVAGFGNDNTGTSLFEAGRPDIMIGSEWTFVIVPIPAPSKVISERGLFTFAEGWEAPHTLGYDIWFDEIKFAWVDDIADPIPYLPSENKIYLVGSTANMEGTQTFYGAITVNHSPHYFDYFSDNPSVALVVGREIKVVGEGTAIITAELQGTEALGQVTLTGFLPPTVAATPPAVPAADVISMFSDVYDDVNVDTWNTNWTSTQVQDLVVAGDNTKMYSDLTYVGIEFLNPMIDATEMTHFHLDVYAPAGDNFYVKLVSFPPDTTAGIDGRELTFRSDTTPAFQPGSWSSLEIPLADLQGAQENWDWAHIGQLILGTTDRLPSIPAQLVLVDNIYFHK